MLSELDGQAAASCRELRRRNLEYFRQYYPELARRFATRMPSGGYHLVAAADALNLRLPDGTLLYRSSHPFALCCEQARQRLESGKLNLAGYARVKDHFGQLQARYMNELIELSAGARVQAEVSLAAVKSVPSCVLLGCGLGYVVAGLLAQAEMVNLLILEPEEEYFNASLSAFAWAELLEYARKQGFAVGIGVGVHPEALPSALQQWFTRQGLFLSTCNLEFIHYPSEAVSECAGILARYRERYFDAPGFLDDELFGLSHALTTLPACRYLKARAQLPPELTALPLFIVGNGPSLEEDLDFLAANAGRALVLACGSAAETLNRRGIRPDFICITERIPTVALQLELIEDEEFFKETILLATDVVHPEVVRRFTRCLMMVKSDGCFDAYLSEILNEGRSAGGEDAPARIDMINPLVGNHGLSAAITLGFRELYLFGIDLGVPVTDKRLHARSSRTYGGEGLTDITHRDEALVIRRPGNFGGEYLSDEIFEMSALRMELLLAAHEGQVHCYNCAHGCRIKGAEPKHSGALHFPPLSAGARAQLGALFSDECSVTLQPPGEQQQMRQREGFERLRAALARQFTPVPQSRTALIKQLMGAAALLTQAAAEGNACAARMLNGSINMACAQIMYAVFSEGDDTAALGRAQRMLTRVGYFLEDAASLYAKVPGYIMGDEHLSKLAGKVGRDHPESPAPMAPQDWRHYLPRRWWRQAPG